MRHKPQPFRRDNIDLSNYGKYWMSLPASEVVAHDVVPGVGHVQSAVRREDRVTLTGPQEKLTVAATEVLRVFGLPR